MLNKIKSLFRNSKINTFLGSQPPSDICPQSSLQTELDALIALFNAGHYAELEGQTRFLLEQSPESGTAWKMLGLSLQAQGKEALPALQKAVKLLPYDAAAHYNLATTLKGLGQFNNAVVSYHRALEIAPDFAAAHYHLALVLTDLGQFHKAVASYRRALEINPDNADVHANLGNTLIELNQPDDAAASYRRALEISPNNAEIYGALGNALKCRGHFNDAATNYRRALEIKPNLAEAHNNLGTTLRDLGQLDDAVASYLRALEIKPDTSEFHSNLGTALRDLNQLEDAMASYQRALVIKPAYAEAHYDLGLVLKELNQFDEAIASYQRALEIKPDYVDAHYSMGIAQIPIKQLDNAIASFRRALEIKPDYADAHDAIGTVLILLGQVDNAVASFRRALEIKPDYAKAHSDLIFSLDLACNTDVAALQQERKRWDQIHAAPLAALQQPHANNADPERRLRIGYVSADFREHSAATVFGTMLVHFDANQFDVFAYSNSKVEDAYTKQFCSSVSTWRNIVGLSDQTVAELILQDEIDILVDLSGHSDGNRLLMFARKPAPLQITAWGYATSTGMKSMDVFFSDPVVVPHEEKTLFTEQVRYLPNFVSSFFPRTFPDIDALPALSEKTITFGSFNRLCKVSDSAFRVWAQVLLAVPNSKMILKSVELDNESTRDRIIGYFSDEGIANERIILLGKNSWENHMDAFNQIDIALDPFPHGGGVTTLEGVMMGVPVVTLRWHTIAGRLSASILTTLGLTDWIAETPEQYVQIAVQKASDLRKLSELRKHLRLMLMSSVIGDAPTYVAAVEHEYRLLWREWCARQKDTD